MRYFLIAIVTFWVNMGISQELVNFYLEPDTADTVVLHTSVYRSSLTIYDGVEIEYLNNSVSVSLCYQNDVSQVQTYDLQSFIIDLAPGYDDYSFDIEIRGDEDGPPCSNSMLSDSRSITIDVPYNPTSKVSIPDNVFEDYLEQIHAGDDLTDNALVFTHRIENISHLFLNDQFIPLSGEIESLEGITSFVDLKDIRCNGNDIIDLDLSENQLLEALTCYDNPISEIDLSDNLLLTYLWCGNSSISNLNLTNNVALEWLNISNTSMSSLDLSNNSQLRVLELDQCNFDQIDLSHNLLLEYLSLDNNQLSEINLSNNDQLISFEASGNFLSTVDVSNLSQLQGFWAPQNQLTELDFSTNSQLNSLILNLNNLSALNLKNGQTSQIETMFTQFNNSLDCIEVDDPSEAPYEGWLVDSHTGFSGDCSLGVSEVDRLEVTLAPNPSKALLNIVSPVTPSEVRIFSVNGEMILSTGQTILDVSSFTSGVYFVEIIFYNQRRILRFVKI